ncbi:hypothetical protein [Mycobacterium bourgelatii]|uniref:Uncharacterized protein n=1 Tax=Mycobacterium bourgelatii TaxID=1273442 RepID=A0A7I9YQ57_MYCBU|nr:hypothetical protein [Mycobacterium bourgelatii]MCV6976077.1 hypothetical protein [Mycobacterium bourgelatii]GFG90809.1 hypothetical protein MBOU_28510 [Mycobacterium bourgelatii]
MQAQIRFDRWYLAIAAPLGIGPRNSELRIESGRLHVKMGWAFTADIPLSSIKRAVKSDTRVFEAGVHGRKSRWLVNGSRKGLVELTIEPPAPAKVLRRSVTVGTLILSVTDPDEFVAACAAASASDV